MGVAARERMKESMLYVGESFNYRIDVEVINTNYFILTAYFKPE